MKRPVSTLTACSFFLAALASSERSRLKDREKQSQPPVKTHWGEEMEGERRRGGEGRMEGGDTGTERWSGREMKERGMEDDSEEGPVRSRMVFISDPAEPMGGSPH